MAGVPRSSLVVLSGVLPSFGLPIEAVAMILGVDALMDMARTTVNVVGNCLASAVAGRWEGELGAPVMQPAPAYAGVGAACDVGAVGAVASERNAG
ncbi:MAG TPA: cation:dicarboxylase symporter family transporter [Gemmatimonadales bacterium]|nr:cation:dicarboxylase symporter family transporter [Gemmatimonadales bacterium]